ncbi:transcription-repair coupling factor [Chengkuizengella axinellae]|uniref:Transcription-repair-coupling factor n=1 Tax=Chengkuizengella axinellae TaxID=3064388 RepID=A0ABT9J5W7_9BACL|nr:transcription-repair coupling factor [Chengkuizengella sp. 2205SS18-9]MDP5276948.1 transcription-repair coupling factor [Chengkuizengella sp. 2205SS18-9]
MKRIIQSFSEDTNVQSIINGVQSNMKEQLVSGLVGSSRQMVLAALFSEMNKPMIIVTHNLFSAQKIYEDLKECFSDSELLLYPANELTLTESAVASPEMVAQRLDVLSKCALGFRGIIISPYAGIRKFLPTPEAIREAHIHLSVGEELNLDLFKKQMSLLGYERVERVEAKGNMSIRGGIIDFYPMTSTTPFRIELFDEEIDSIRSFDISDQRSIDKVSSIIITPCEELIADERRFQNAANHVKSVLDEYLNKINDAQLKEKLTSSISNEIDSLKNETYFKDIYKYSTFIYPERNTLLDYMSDDSLIVVDEPLRLLETIKQIEKDEAESITTLLELGRTIPAFILAEEYNIIMKSKPFPVVYFSLFLRQIPHAHPQNIVNFTCRPMQNFHGQMNVLKSEIERWKKAGTDVVILANGEERIDKVRRVLGDYNIEEPNIINNHLTSGFEFPSIHLAVITEEEMFNKKHRKVRKANKRVENAEKIKSYLDLKLGDYVVHVNHGIGKYVGIGTLEINGIHKDYIHIMYANDDKLSIPIDQLDLVQKYVSSEDKEPKLYKLGGTEWAKAKNKARSSVKDIADDLIKLYAARQESAGYSFSKDTTYQAEFESMFPYEETTDQLKSIHEIKADMEKRQPMDRLLCGDVGYGKTEVAIRAAFKAAMEGKQVAILVPTTILAHQHFETFQERFSGYPIKIDVLSRFRSRKEQKETMKGIKNATVDVVIGTHRLLSADVVFKDIGLLIVDEEQRFGVSHKEKLKRLKTNVDVLTLTATPIPRTLHMSMLGVRDLSVIETPPENRFPVQTYVVEHSHTLVREAIERELARNGQVYYLFNRVQGIYQMAEQISALVPDARVAVSHGKMSEQELEKTILDFLDGEYDVLVSTSIIETGVDIPNVNTLLVHDADKMGLSQLYQLRGRVGRSNRVAYAYLTYQRDKVLNEVAEKRLQAIKEFTELGSGFKIAMRDLSIRGAGNLLGAEQHGFIASVGFDLYSQMLADEISKKKAVLHGEVIESTKEIITQIDIGIDAYIPPEYIYDSMQKIEIYKKVASIRELDEVTDLFDELIDRFGDIPDAVANLLAVAKLKVYGRIYSIDTISRKNDDIIMIMDDEQNGKIDGQKLLKLSSQYQGKIKLVPGQKIQIIVKGKGLDSDQILELMEQFLVQYKEVFKDKEELQNAAR